MSYHIKQPFITLDQWIRRRLRKLLWRQWKKPKTRYKKMVQLGVKADRAKKAVAGGRGPWYNAGASPYACRDTKPAAR